MTSSQQIIEQGLAHQREGRLTAAAECFEQVLRNEPNNAAAHYLLGLTHLQTNQLERGLERFKVATVLEPRRLDYSLALGSVLLASGRAAEAVNVLEKILQLHPDSVPTLVHLGEAWLASSEPSKAKPVLARAAQLAPRDAAVLRSYGLCCLQLSGLEREAIKPLTRATELKPSASTYNDLGYALQRVGDSRQAALAFNRALDFDPKHKNALNNLSTAYKSMGQLTEAVNASRKAVQVDPKFAVGHCNLGIALSSMGLQAEAENALREALTCNPAYAKAHSHRLFNLQYKPDVTPTELLEAHSTYEQQQASHIRPLQHAGRSFPLGRPLTIGFVSDGFARHPIGYFLHGLLKHVDASELEITCYSDRHREDELTAAFKALAPRWRSVGGTSNADLAAQVRKDQIDILFDLSGHAGGKRMLLFARKPAPIQVTWMGYVGTTGLSTMDYLLCDGYHLPASDEAYIRETVIRMPDDYVCYTPPDYAPEVNSLPYDQNGYMTFGSFNQPAKLNEPLIAQWSEILLRVANSRLLLIYAGFDDATVQQRIQAIFQRHGISSSRISMRGKIPHRDLLAAYGSVDLCLDTQPYSGGLTTCEALWMGVPVVTKTGSTFAGRHSTSHLRNVGLAELCSQNWSQYAQVATELAEQPQRLRALRSVLRPRMATSPLGNESLFAKNWLEVVGKLPGREPL